ncbi:hypothetical protein cgR_2365 [Corynebacterium glutamicum R]|uniref:ABC transmembrane type-1 domain-containing protein n=1 Tax=Corynebacterium glutamicum (strain R) TaxID=340322 RepID=A0AB72VDA1_CORGB|nr:hypothetical protein cgR_2365 [Corynebacterium glutamicum R]
MREQLFHILSLLSSPPSPLGNVWHHLKLRFHHHASNAEEVLPSLCLAHPSGIHDCLLGAVHRGFLPLLYEVHHYHQRQVGWHRQLRQSFLPTRRFHLSLRFHRPRGHRLRDHSQHLRLPLGVVADPQTPRYQLFPHIFFMPNLIGGIVLGYTWQTMINAVLSHYATTISADWKFGYAGLIMLLNWQLIGYMMIIYIAGLQNVPPELIEAAELDGVNKWEMLRHVTIPMVMPSITICLFLTLSNSFKLFDQNLALTNGAPGGQTEMVALNIINTLFNRMNVEGVGQAKAVIFVVVVVVIAYFQLRATRSKEIEA